MSDIEEEPGFAERDDSPTSAPTGGGVPAPPEPDEPEEREEAEDREDAS
jgi:hypothetical protein